MIKKLTNMCNCYKKMAQGVLGLGESSLSKEQIKEKLADYKNRISTLLPIIEHRPGWSNQEGKIALAIIDKILNDEKISYDEKERAKMDVKTNLRMLDLQEFSKYIDAAYNVLSHLL